MKKRSGVWPFFKENIKNTRVFGYFFLKILLTPWFLNRFS